MIRKKILAAILAANFAFCGLSTYEAHSNTNIAYAEEDENTKFIQQKQELEMAINDSINVTSSEAYGIVIDQSIKDTYLDAVNYGKSILANINNYNFDDLREATIRINEAKIALGSRAALDLKLNQLEKSIEYNQNNATAARILLDNYPETVKNIRQNLLSLLEQSNILIENARAILEKYR